MNVWVENRRSDPKVMRRGNFTFIDGLKSKINDFIEHDNDTMAKPFRWTY